MGYFKELNGNSLQRVNIESADVMLPVEIQGRFTKTVQTHTAVSIGANATSNGAIVSCDGFDKINASVVMTSGTGMSLWLDWSFDGSTFFGGTPLSTTSSVQASVEFPVQAPYFRLGIKNNDATNPKTTSAYVYLKA
jgi:hypothetical protein